MCDNRIYYINKTAFRLCVSRQVYCIFCTTRGFLDFFLLCENSIFFFVKNGSISLHAGEVLASIIAQPFFASYSKTAVSPVL